MGEELGFIMPKLKLLFLLFIIYYSFVDHKPFYLVF